MARRDVAAGVAGLDEIGAGLSEPHDFRGQDVERVGPHEWVKDECVPFGGHLLLRCACGCPGPFVLSWEERGSAECGVFQAWRDGSARLAICGEGNRLDLRTAARRI